MERYTIIDEPESKPWGEKVIVDPIIILLAAILVPFFWNPPYWGRIWMPALWLLINGYALGSSTLKQEIKTLLKGGFFCFVVFYLSVMLPKWTGRQLSVEAILPYTRILFYGVYFMTLYLVVFKQSRSYELFKYVRGSD